MKYIHIGHILLIIFISPSCEQDRDRLFKSLSHRRTGIDFKNMVKDNEEFNVLDYAYFYNGGGVAVGDLNNDGLPEIFFSGNLTGNKLYLNKGKFRFEDITERADVKCGDRWNTGVTMADINGDGFLDIYVCHAASDKPEKRRNQLFLNEGDLTFTECAAKYGIDDPFHSTHCAFFDYDKDGDLDLLVLNHTVDKPMMSRANQMTGSNRRFGEQLYKNTGDKFINVSKEVGMIPGSAYYGLGLAVADFNNDYWPDIYICNDYFLKDRLYINQKNGSFTDEIESFFDHTSFASMGNDAADFNNDGYIDLITPDMLPEDNYEQKLVARPDNPGNYFMLKNKVFQGQVTRNMLQVNNHGSFFTEIGQFSGVFATNWSWAPLFCDFDNDGNKDLYITTGFWKNNTNLDFVKLTMLEDDRRRTGQHTMSKMELIEKIPATLLKNYIYKNNGDLTFTNVTESWGDEVPSFSNGAAYADFDNDGDMDIVVNNINSYAFVYRNNANKRNLNHFLKIRFDGTGLNRGGIGAKVEVFCKDQIYVQEFMPSRGYMSSMNHELIFGLGKSTLIDSLKVIWPDLLEEVFKNVVADQTLILHQKNAHPLKELTVQSYQPIFVPLNSKILDYKHVENEYVDFRKQILLHHLLSTQGPHIAKGDINKDGLEDLYFSGARDSPGSLYIQKKDGSFELQVQSCFVEDKSCEDIGAVFFDVDGDQDQDLYVVSGGNEFTKDAPELQDRLYLNNGKGLFTKSADRLPVMLTSGSCVKAGDPDNDGDMDLFVGGRLVPGSYPLAPRSYLLENNGKGYFKDVTERYNKILMNPGMVTDAVWTDFNGDKRLDIIIVGEWMGIRVFLNDGTRLTEITDQSGLKDSEGWWNAILAEDFDKDGDMDYVIGNLGLNSRLKTSVNEPVTLYAKDFDNNGSIDAVLCSYIQGKCYPIYPKDDLQRQLPVMEKKYPTYESFANQTVTDIFSPEELKDALVLKAFVFASCYLENKGNAQFSLSHLPPVAQFSPIYAIQTGDYNQDGFTDMILAGNFFGTRLRFGEYDANKGLLLAGKGKGDFTVLNDLQSGLHVNGEVRDITNVRSASGNNILVFALNNDSVRIYGEVLIK
jgi:enediyne biosynthesis protein E4